MTEKVKNISRNKRTLRHKQEKLDFVVSINIVETLPLPLYKGGGWVFKIFPKKRAQIFPINSHKKGRHLLGLKSSKNTFRQEYPAVLLPYWSS